MRILLFGKNGQLGWELRRSLQGLGEVAAYDWPEVDFRAPASLAPLVAGLGPDVVVNAAAYTDVDKAESEAEIARIINAEAPAILAGACRDAGSVFIHYSTDYIFDGEKGSPYVEEDRPAPLNVYGRSKLQGERGVLAAGGVSLIFRTAWVYSLRRDSFVTKVLRWARTQSELHIVDDQVSNPTWARALAEVTARVLANAGPEPLSRLRECAGLYHLAGRGHTSRLDWAKAIVRFDPDPAQETVKAVLPAKSAAFPTPARRPPFSALDCGRFERAFGLRLPEWEESLRLAMRDGPERDG